MSESQENSNKERMNQAEESEQREDLAVAGMRTASEEAKLDAAILAIKPYLHKA